MAKLSTEESANLTEAILQVVTAIGPLGVELYLKLEQLFQLGPDEQANIAAAIKIGLAADSDTLTAIQAWKKQVGLLS